MNHGEHGRRMNHGEHRAHGHGGKANGLGEADGVMLIDESGVVKQGQDSVGVAAQYCGSVGKVANGQVGVHLGYVSRQGYTLLDSHLFMPAEWFDETHTDRRKACGVPADLTYQTKPEIGLELLRAAINRNGSRRSGSLMILTPGFM